MIRFKANAIGYPTVDKHDAFARTAATASIRTPPSDTRARGLYVAASWIPLAIVGCFAAALLAPSDVSALGVLLMGPLHIAFELRNVVSAAPRLCNRSWAVPTAAVATLCACLRAFAVSPRYEITVVGLLAIVAMLATSRSLGLLRALMIAIFVGGLVGLGIWIPLWWLVIVSHLHNVLPLLVSLRRMGKTFAIRSAVMYSLASVLFLSGAMDSLLRRASSSPVTVAGRHLKIERVAEVITPPLLDGIWSLRWLALFGFGQLMHYAFWCLLLRPDRATQTSQPNRSPIWLAGLATAVTATVFLIFVGAHTNSANARSLYGTFAIVHIVFEIPALFALLRISNDAKTSNEIHSTD